MSDLPKVTRPIEERKLISEDDKKKHWELGIEYFDGTRDQGYGGYIDDGRWEPVAKTFADYYNLIATDCILEIGCAKAFLLKAFYSQLQTKEIWGLDISKYALETATQFPGLNLVCGNAKDLPFEDKIFELTISINSLHNILNINDLIAALREIERVAQKKYITVGAFRNDEEKKYLDKWAVVATTYLHEQDWLEVFDRAGYTGDYYWFKPHQSFGVGK